MNREKEKQIHRSMKTLVKKDPRFNINGIWLTDIREKAFIYAIIRLSSKSKVKLLMNDNEFVGAEVTVNKELADHGYFYEVSLDESDVKKISDHDFLYDGNIKPLVKSKIPKDLYRRLGIKVTIDRNI